MKKVITAVVAAATLFCTALVSTSCDKVKNGSVIKNCTVTIVYDGDKEQDITIELYKNYAPATIEHFTYLSENGYYDNTAVSNLNGYFEFGAYDKEKYEGIITDEYVKGKTVVNGDDRYTSDKSIYGEFKENGIGGNKLDFSSGALVLKRDYSESSSKSYYNTGKATMAITFSASGSYFNDKTKYAILGKLSKDDEITVKNSDGEDEKMTSYDFVYKLYTGYKTEKDDDETYSNTYYYFGYDYSSYPYSEGADNYDADEKANYATLNAKLNVYGRYFKRDIDGNYFYKDGEEYKALDEENEDDQLLIDAFTEKSLYLSILPYKAITIKKITVEK